MVTGWRCHARRIPTRRALRRSPPNSHHPRSGLCNPGAIRVTLALSGVTGVTHTALTWGCGLILCDFGRDRSRRHYEGGRASRGSRIHEPAAPDVSTVPAFFDSDERANLELAMPVLPAKLARELRSIVEPFDRQFLAKTWPDPQQPADLPWWLRRSNGCP
jgi:hypothetical protein